MKTQTQFFNLLPSTWYLANNPRIIVAGESMHMRRALNLNSKAVMASHGSYRVKHNKKLIFSLFDNLFLLIKHIAEIGFKKRHDLCIGHGFS